MSSPSPFPPTPSSLPTTKVARPARFPEGRCGTTRFCQIIGIGRVTFFTKYRPEPLYIELFDIRVNQSGYLNMSEAAARKYARERTGQLAKPTHGAAS